MASLNSIHAFRRALTSTILLAGVILSTSAARTRADQRDFPFTYSWLQATKGEKELAFHSRYRRRDNLWQQQLEFEYGVSDKFSLAPYLVFQHGAGRSLHYDAWKLEARYQLGTYRTNTVLPGLYMEYEKPNGEEGEIEGKIILSHFDNHGRHLSFNYIVEKEFAEDAEVEHSYSLGYAVPAGRRGLRVGGELIHELASGRVLAGPTLFAPLGPQSSLATGYAFPVNGKDGNRAEFRLFVQYHWF